jgi:hypothetical protein
MDQYLSLYSEPEINGLEGFPEQLVWEHVVVIPASRESTDFVRPLPSAGGRNLLILVINQSENDSDEVTAANQKLAIFVQLHYRMVWNSDPEYGLSLLIDDDQSSDLLLVDCFSKKRRLPEKGGVGHARKIGADLAACLIWTKKVRSKWIHCSDADVRLPETYFTALSCHQDRLDSTAALIYPFRHMNVTSKDVSADVVQATQSYDLSLRYYVAGMRFAGSPYAFHTIGSTMAVNARHYRLVRGFPKRQAAEDFYLLNKLAKLGSVQQLEENSTCEVICIAPRESDRVPFGTGAAVSRIVGMESPLNEYHFYQPEVFVLLKSWLQALPEFWNSSTCNLFDINGEPVLLTGLSNRKRYFLAKCLQELKVEKALAHALNHSKNLEQFLLQMRTWFDAFRTLRLIHIMRDHELGSVPFSQLEQDQLFLEIVSQDIELKSYYQSYIRLISG